MIELLDVTLRDGGHTNEGRFSDSFILDHFRSVESSGVQNIEVGIVVPGVRSGGGTFVSDIQGLLSRFPEGSDSRIIFMVRADWGALDDLPDATQQASQVRVAFHKNHYREAIAAFEFLSQKGYAVHFNPINTPGYEQSHLREVIRTLSALNPWAISIVDTNGTLLPASLDRILDTYLEAICPSTRIGLHLHDKLLLAHGLALRAIERIGSSRPILVDASLLGIGRSPGNLKLELIAGSLNSLGLGSYDISSFIRMADKHSTEIEGLDFSGYTMPYGFGAILGRERNLVEELLESDRVKMEDIYEALSASGDTL